ncbi:hypothetical protein OGA58_004473 [Salmonella enterica]|nr:hypothetical protein [Salmonella enterica]
MIYKREYQDLTAAERREIVNAFKRDYLGQGLVNKYRLSREAFRQLRQESR